MTKRYRETLDEVVFDDGGGAGAPGPRAFRWRGQPYTVLQVLGHWREDAGWWRRPDGVPVRIERTDLWRVEAGDRVATGGRNGDGSSTRGVYELVRRGEIWRLDRVWD